VRSNRRQGLRGQAGGAGREQQRSGQHTWEPWQQNNHL
jgi:hypothetical protein